MSKSFVFTFHQETNGALFEQVLLALKKRYRLVKADELEQLMKSGEALHNIAHISFDDGHRSFYDTVLPLLQKHTIPVSLFLSPYVVVSEKNFWFQEIADYDEVLLKKILARQLNLWEEELAPFPVMAICKSLPYGTIEAMIADYQQQTGVLPKPFLNMTREEVLAAAQTGLVTIGAHSMHHPVLASESDAACEREIVDSVKELEKMLNHPVRYFAYPNGRPGMDFSEREKNILRSAGISMAFSTELSALRPGTDMLSIPRTGFPRMGLPPQNPLIYFRLAMEKKWVDIKSVFRPSEREVRERIIRISQK